MDISKHLLEGINLTWDEEDCFQTLDYENIPFRCCRCHEHGHLSRECPLGVQHNSNQAKEVKDSDGFTKVTGRKRKARRTTGLENNKKPQTNNRFEALANENQQEGEAVKQDQDPTI